MELKTPFIDLLPPLSTDEREALEKDIAIHGVINPVVVDEDNNILDGHHRYDIEKNPPIKRLCGLSDAEKRAFVQSSNQKRRNMTPEQKKALREEMIETAMQLKEEDPKKWTQQRIADCLGVAQQTVADWFDDISNTEAGKTYIDARLSIPKESIPDIVKRSDAGETQSQIAADYGTTQPRISQVIKQAKAKEENKKKQNAIAKKKAKGFNGLYDVIVIDPPWDMKKIDREVAPEQSEFDYPTMSEDELGEMNLPINSDCHFFLWTTHKFLPMAFRLLDSWELKYVCAFVWHKPGGFQPFGLPQYNCEFALYARKGSPEFVDVKAFNTCFEAPRGKHSEKPEEFYELLRRVTGGRRIDIFNRREIEGFDVWGNEA